MKSVAAVIAMLLICFSALLFFPVSGINPITGSTVASIGTDNRLYTAHNYSQTIYSRDASGEIQDIYPIGSFGKDTYTVSAVYKTEDSLYQARTQVSGNFNKAGLLEIVKTDSINGAQTALWQINLQQLNLNTSKPVSSIWSDGSSVMFAAISADGATATAYLLSGESKSAATPVTSHTLTKGQFVSVAYSNSSLYGLTSDNRLLHIADSKARELKMPDNTAIKALSAAPLSAMALNCQGSGYYTINENGFFETDFNAEAAKATFMQKLTMRRNIIFFGGLIISGIFLFVGAAIIVYRLIKRFASRLTIITAVSAVLMFVLICASSCFICGNYYTADKLGLAQEYADNQAKLKAASQNTDIFKVEGNTAFVQASHRLPSGLTAQAAYGKQISGLIDSCLEQKSSAQAQILTEHGAFAVGIAPIFSATNIDSFALSFVSLSGQKQFLLDLLSQILFIGLAAMVPASILIWLTLKSKTKPLRKIISSVNNIVYGIPVSEALNVGNDEIGELWSAIQEINVSQKIKAYETETSISSFKRFVPQNIEKLLSRANVGEISFGDMTVLSGAIAVFSINNREQIRQLCTDHSYLVFVNKCFEHLNRCMSSSDGIMLSTDFNLAGCRIMLEAEQSYSFAEKLFAFSQGQITENPSVCILLHQASFLYGIAGTKERAFVFQSSQELDFISSYCDKLGKIGVKAAITEKLLNAIQIQTGSVRYIGFISSGDKSYKLYELLCSGTDKNKSMILSYNDKLQEGINLFYKRDFYLARNIFSNILKTNPYDGVACWYLFACEHYFNIENVDEISFNLFSLDISLNALGFDKGEVL